MRYECYAYPWNCHDLTQQARRMQDMGMTGVTLAASYHAGKFIHPGDPQQRVYFPQDGTIYFRPGKAYGRLKPQVSDLTQRCDVLEEWVADASLAVSAWVVLNHNSRLGHAFEDVVVRNCYGDAYPYSLCPSHADVLEYGQSLCVDIAERYGIHRLLLESPGYLTYSHGYHHEFSQIDQNPWLDAMLGLCFCNACRRRASDEGIDADALSARIRAGVDTYLSGPENLSFQDAMSRLDEWNALDADLAALHIMRSKVVTSFVEAIRMRVRPGVSVQVISTTQRPHLNTYLEGGDLPALAEVSDGLELPLYQHEFDALKKDAEYVWAKVDAARTSAILRPGPPDMRSESQLRMSVDFLRSVGVSGISFYNFGMLRPHNLDWVKRALAD